MTIDIELLLEEAGIDEDTDDLTFKDFSSFMEATGTETISRMSSLKSLKDYKN